MNVVPPASGLMISRTLFDPEVNADDTACRNVKNFSYSDTESLSLQGDLFYAETLSYPSPSFCIGFVLYLASDLLT
jgi:hypothetical protein